MTDTRRKAAEEWAVANFRHNPEGVPGWWEYEDYVVPAHLAGQECGEQRAAAEVAALRERVKALEQAIASAIQHSWNKDDSNAVWLAVGREEKP